VTSGKLAGGAARAALAAACLMAGVGLVEWALLALVSDPFAAGWGTRALSLASFAGTYALAGLIAGGAAGLAIAAAASPLRSRPGMLAGLTCGVLGLLYAAAWARAIEETPGWPEAIGPTLWVVCPILFAACGAMIGERSGSRPTRAAPVASAAALAMLFPLMALMPARAPQAPHHEPAAGPAPAAATAEAARNVIVILVDTLRADHLSLHGYPRATSPRIDAFAAQGVAFETAIVSKTKTSPSVASLLTGTWPHTHGIVNCRTRLPDEAVTLAEILRAAGFATHSIVANANIGASFRFDQGYDSVDEIWAAPGAGEAAMLTGHALDWLRRQVRPAAGEPRRFFLYLHYIDPHAPYAPPEPWSSRFVDDAHYGAFAGVKVGLADTTVHGITPAIRLPERPWDVDYYIAQYDGEIAYMDHHVGRLLAGLTQLGLDRDTLVVFVSDHGEALSEHDVFFSHGGFAYDNTAHVPLVMRLPGRLPAGARRGGIVQTAALAPTVLQAVGVPAHPAMELPSFWAQALGTQADAPGSPAPDQGTFIEAGSVADRITTAFRTASHKLVENPGGFDQRPGWFSPATVLSMNAKQQVLEMRLSGRQFRARFELYDLLSDPGETVNLAVRMPDERAKMRAALESWRRQGAGRDRLEADDTETMSEDVIRNLKSLGYIN